LITNAHQTVKKYNISARYQCLKLVILATWEAEIGRIMFLGQPGRK
jgi:hypothetical protein